MHPRHVSMRSIGVALQCVLAFLVLWVLFHSLGQCLLRLPSSFHEGTLWKEGPWNL